MSEGIVELTGTEEKPTNHELGSVEEATNQEAEADTTEAEMLTVKSAKPKTRKQKRDQRGRMFVEEGERRERAVVEREREVMRVKSLKRELNAEEQRMKENQERRQRDKVL